MGWDKFLPAWVDTLPDSASPYSEWISPYDGESNLPVGWYVLKASDNSIASVIHS
jgi:hypothetical protein